MKNVELKLIAELIKNARRSDRDLSKAVGVSQPTVSRIRSRLEKEGFVREYTMIPDFHRLGYEILAVTFAKLKETLTAEETERIRVATGQKAKRAPHDIIMLEKGIGLGYGGIIVSLHKNYSSFVEFRNSLKRYTFLADDIDSFLIDLAEEKHYIPLSLSLLAGHLQSSKAKEEK